MLQISLIRPARSLPMPGSARSVGSRHVGDPVRAVGDDLRPVAVGADLERILVLQLEQVRDLAEDARDCRILHAADYNALGAAGGVRRSALFVHARDSRPHRSAADDRLQRRPIPAEMRSLAREFDLGGIIYFSRNVEAPEQVAEIALAAAGAGARRCRCGSPSTRKAAASRACKRAFTRWPPMATLGRAGDGALAARFARRWRTNCRRSASRSTSRRCSTC